jgi:hypothetical protein
VKDPELVERLAAHDPDRAAILRSCPADVRPVATPFYRKARVVDVDVVTPAGAILYRYGLEGDRVVALGERPEAVYELNGWEDLVLERSAVPAYLRFFFDSVGRRRIRIVERTQEIPFLPRAPEDPRPPAEKPEVRAIAVEPSPGGDLRAVAAAIFDVMLVEITLAATLRGRVEPVAQRLLVHRLDIVPA